MTDSQKNDKRARLVLTAGPTREWFDPVRFLSNPSSGEMGYRVALAALERPDLFREVVFIHGPVADKFQRPQVNDTLPRKKVEARRVAVETTRDMLAAVREACLVPGPVLLVMAAAPLDYRPVKSAEHKLKKGSDDLSWQMTRNPDILKEMAGLRKREKKADLWLVGFAAETQNALAEGWRKLREKELEMIFVNHVYKQENGFGPGQSRLWALDKAGEAPKQRAEPAAPTPDEPEGGDAEVIGPGSKINLAAGVVARLADLLKRKLS